MHKKVISILVLVGILVALGSLPYTKVEAFGSFKNPFGGRVFMKPAPIIQQKQTSCESGGECGYGNVSMTFIDLTSTSCPGGVWTQSPNFTSKKSPTYCSDASTDNKTKTTVTIRQWTLGLHNKETSTVIGQCTCTSYYPPAEAVVNTSQVKADLVHIKMFGTSKY